MRIGPGIAALMTDMRSAGWTFKTTSDQHIKALAPDGRTMQLLPSKDGSRRTVANRRADFERWQRKQAAQSKPETEETVSQAAELPMESAQRPTTRWCDLCNADVDISKIGWPVHRMHHASMEPGSCPECDWTGTRRGLGSHLRMHKVKGLEENEAPAVEITRATQPPLVAVAPEPAIVVVPGFEPAPSTATDSLAAIVEDLITLATRIERYAAQKNAENAELKDVLRRFLGAAS